MGRSNTTRRTAFVRVADLKRNAGNKEKMTKIIKLYHDRLSIFSDWGFFIISMLLIILFWISTVNFLNNALSEETRIIGFVVLLFALLKMLVFVRLPDRFLDLEEVIKK